MAAELGVTGSVLLRSLPDPAAVLQRDHLGRVRLLHGNPALAGILGRSLEELLGIDAHTVFDPDDRARSRRALDEVRDTGATEAVLSGGAGRGLRPGELANLHASRAEHADAPLTDPDGSRS